MTKKSFIQKLINATPEQLNKIIEEKGKKPKLINVFVEKDKNTNTKK